MLITEQDYISLAPEISMLACGTKGESFQHLADCLYSVAVWLASPISFLFAFAMDSYMYNLA